MSTENESQGRYTALQAIRRRRKRDDKNMAKAVITSGLDNRAAISELITPNACHSGCGRPAIKTAIRLFVGYRIPFTERAERVVRLRLLLCPGQYDSLAINLVNQLVALLQVQCGTNGLGNSRLGLGRQFARDH